MVLIFILEFDGCAEINILSGDAFNVTESSEAMFIAKPSNKKI